jgi:hypothetical protein
MRILHSTRVKALAGGLALTLFALVGVSAWGLLQALLALGNTTGQFFLFAMVGAAAPYIVAALVLTLLAGGLFLWLLIALASQVSLPRLENERLATVAGYVEREVPAARAVGLSEWLTPTEPTPAERREALKERYAAGKLSDAEFERELQAIIESEEKWDEGYRDDLDSVLVDRQREPETERT